MKIKKKKIFHEIVELSSDYVHFITFYSDYVPQIINFNDLEFLRLNLSHNNEMNLCIK